MCRVSGFWVQAFGFRVPGFGFRVSGFRVTPSEDDAAEDHEDKNEQEQGFLVLSPTIRPHQNGETARQFP